MELDDEGLGVPLRRGPDGGLAVVATEESVRAMLEQILFTIPGERVNRPTFGVGVQRYVFEPSTRLLGDRLRVALDENVREHIGRSVRVLAVQAQQGLEEAELHVKVSFEIVGTVSGRRDLELVVSSEATS
jgi:uncharacterized protein